MCFVTFVSFVVRIREVLITAYARTIRGIEQPIWHG
jgi:hypothetical protein